MPSDALRAATRGSTFFGYNPADINRTAAKLAAAGKRRPRRKRPPRPPRPPR